LGSAIRIVGAVLRDRPAGGFEEQVIAMGLSTLQRTLGRRTRRRVVLVLLSLLLAGPAFARHGISRDEAVEYAREIMGGRVIRAEPRERDGRQYYNIRMLTDDGRMRHIEIDRESGRRLEGDHRHGKRRGR